MYYPGWDSVKSFTLFFAPMRMKWNMRCGGFPWWQSGAALLFGLWRAALLAWRRLAERLAAMAPR